MTEQPKPDDDYCGIVAVPEDGMHKADALVERLKAVLMAADYTGLGRKTHAWVELDLLEALQREVKRKDEALEDALAGWRYIRAHHGDLYGVGWDRVEQSLTSALSALRPAVDEDRG